MYEEEFFTIFCSVIDLVLLVNTQRHANVQVLVIIKIYAVIVCYFVNEIVSLHVLTILSILK